MFVRAHFLIIAVATIFVLPHTAQAQSLIPNGEFEDWSGSELIYSDPQQWSSLNETHFLLGYEDFTVQRTEDAIEGNYALHVETQKLCSDQDGFEVCYLVPGTAVLGDIFINPTDLAIITFGVDFNERPEALNGWYKYFPVLGDSCHIEVELSRFNDAVGQREVIGFGEFFQAEAVTQYTQISIPITYSSESTPEKIRIVARSGVISQVHNEAYPNGSTLLLDWINLGDEIVTTGLSSFERPDPISVYPNPSNSIAQYQLTLDNPGSYQVQVYSTTGSRVFAESVYSSGLLQDVIDVSNWPSGPYMMTVSDERGRAVATQTMMVGH